MINIREHQHLLSSEGMVGHSTQGRPSNVVIDYRSVTCFVLQQDSEKQRKCKNLISIGVHRPKFI